MQTNVSFVKTREELEAMARNKSFSFYNQEKLQIYWLFDQKAYEKLLPPGLEPVIPFAVAYISNFMRPEFLYPYTEGALFILASFGGEIGVYCLAMPLDGDDQALAGGREFYGYPKKEARVKLLRRGNHVEGWIERNDVRFFEASAEIGAYNHPDSDAMIGPIVTGQTQRDCVYLLNYHLDCTVPEGQTDGYAKVDYDKNPLDFIAKGNFFSDINLVRQKNDIIIHTHEPACVEFILRPSEDDPWAELTPTKILGASYMRYDTHMLGAKRLKTYVTEKERLEVAPHLFARWDTALLGKYHASYKAGNFYH